MGEPVTRVGLRDGTTIDVQATYEDVCGRISYGGLAMYEQPLETWKTPTPPPRPVAIAASAVAWCKPLRTEAT